LVIGGLDPRGRFQPLWKAAQDDAVKLIQSGVKKGVMKELDGAVEGHGDVIERSLYYISTVSDTRPTYSCLTSAVT
jgi:hypothetical protein